MAGRLFIISGPSGVGKTTLAEALLRRRPGLATVISRTTRGPRPGDGGAKRYVYVSRDDFERARAAGDFLEWAEVHGRLYGTPRNDVEALLAEGKDVLLEIDVEGAKQVKEQIPRAVTIFIEPPSWEVLEARLRGRATEDEQALDRRLQTARHELTEAGTFDHRVANDRLEEAVDQVNRILNVTQED